ncbi:MAG: PP2C family serine/threonine-protein phosphatase [Polyangiales bacterium]
MWARGEAAQDVLIATGAAAGLALEAHALQVLEGKLAVPRVVASVDDDPAGPYLVLALPQPGATSITAAAADLPPAQAMALLDEALGFAAALEGAGLGWTPRIDDFYVLEGRLGLRRLRGARRLGNGGRIDARHVVEELGGAFVAEPGSLLPPRFLHFVLPSRSPRGVVESATIETARADLRTIAEDTAIPPDELPGCATLSDLGLLRERHEDAVAVAKGDDYGVVVVCDGVSASYRSDVASALAVATVRDRLVAEHATKEPTGAIHDAIREAHQAICDQREITGHDPAGTTIVAALVQRRRVSVGWVGDSRAYWLGAGGDALLTRDHSWLNDVLASGVLTPDEALASPHAHALTRCLGPLEGGDPLLHAAPDLLEFDAPGPGYLVLCTDGLWNYFPAPDDLAALAARAGGSARPAAIARALVNAALSQGGQDNVTVAVLAVT